MRKCIMLVCEKCVVSSVITVNLVMRNPNMVVIRLKLTFGSTIKSIESL